MARGISLFAICLGGAMNLILASGTLDAMPLGVAKGFADAVSSRVILKVHGCHNLCQRDRAGWHRHGPNCRRAVCGD